MVNCVITETPTLPFEIATVMGVDITVAISSVSRRNIVITLHNIVMA